MNIAVDAMGGDYAPASVVEGAVQAVKQANDIYVTLVGDERRILLELSKFGNTDQRIRIRPASDVIAMDDPPAQALRKKKDSSIKVAMELVKSGEASAVVSAGNTGAILASSIMVFKPIKGIDRPTLATFLPTIREGDFVILVDAGANVDCKAVQLFQFGIMAHVYAQYVLGKRSPKIGLLSIGEEDNKGNEVSKGAFQLFSQSNLNFIGNVEAKEVFRGTADILVCDGFTGNIALKIGEGLAEMFINSMRKAFSQNIWSKLAYFLMRKHLRDFKAKVDYSEYGGAPLLGINGVCIIGHGSSSAKAIKNAISLASKLAKMNLHEHISSEMAQNAALKATMGKRSGFFRRVNPYYKSFYSGE